MFNLTLVILFSLSIGSFLNHLIYKIIINESIFSKNSSRSICPKCKNQLKWYHNIPLLSYLFLRGKCGFCNEKISLQYPIVEFLSLFIALTLFFIFDSKISINLILLYIIFIVLLVISIIDLKIKMIPEYLSIFALFLVFFVNKDFILTFNYIFISIGITYCFKSIIEMILNKIILGEGDILIFGIASGLILDFKNIMIFLILVSILSIIPLIYLHFKKSKLLVDKRFDYMLKDLNNQIKNNKNDLIYINKLNIIKDSIEFVKLKDYNENKALPFVPFLSISLFIVFVFSNLTFY